MSYDGSIGAGRIESRAIPVSAHAIAAPQSPSKLATASHADQFARPHRPMWLSRSNCIASDVPGPAAGLARLACKSDVDDHARYERYIPERSLERQNGMDCRRRTSATS